MMAAGEQDLGEYGHQQQPGMMLGGEEDSKIEDGF